MLAPDHQAVAVDLLSAFLRSVELLAGQRQHFQTSRVVDHVLTDDVAP
jgi:hypothetical protein